MNSNPEWRKDALLDKPYFAPLHPFVYRLGRDAFPTLQDCNALLEWHTPAVTVQSGQPVRFVAQQHGKLPFESQYEPRCYLKGEVATREGNWHDLFNALVWMAFPKAKTAINARHYHVLTDHSKGADTGMSGGRGSTRDTSTLLDESGVIVVCADAELARLLRDFQWKELFWVRREQVRSSMGFYLFGHGLYEKALRPYIGMTGQGLLLAAEPEFFNWALERQLEYLDGRLSAYLSDRQHLTSTRELTPVPLLGIPGWAAENECAVYYDNKDYFRAGRHGRSAS